ncbi:hypothetical protein ACFFX1_00545 [Dactylosporangium sucinum]|uniref:Uncharacterized protein n=1 Tax=Dactylosporangium sucinum TaxID=1424081 RepID=A0A917TFE3_9ACTN|nr:hypothetical protein [Dactylosporangium sucinum]GGM21475.1 hypothetical protein GCM10007977_023220 [Dactylosporangium sucinum]
MSENAAQAREDLPVWASESHQNFEALVRGLDAPAQAVAADPFVLVPYLQAYVSGLPLSEFQQDDWVTLHTDLGSFVAEYMIVKHGARWAIRDAPRSPRGFRYVIETASGFVDPFAVVATEFRALPIEITRMIASAELTTGVIRQRDE